jgi:hypothetical protein
VALGSLSSLVDSRAILGGAAAVASLSYAGEAPWALAAGGAIVIANCAIHVARVLLDVREVHDAAKEIAFVAALQDASRTAAGSAHTTQGG